MRYGDMDKTRRPRLNIGTVKKTAVAGLTGAALAAATVAAMLATTGQAAAQNLCMPRDKIIEVLNSRYAEEPISRGLASGGQMVEVFSSPDGDTWTLLLTAPDGTSCLMAEGQGWSSLPGPTLGRVS